MPLTRGRTQFFEEHGEVHPIRNSPGYDPEVEKMQREHRTHERRAHFYRGVKREKSDIQRPDWAKGLSELEVRKIAKQAGRNPNAERWWQGARLEPGTGEYKFMLQNKGAPRKTAAPTHGMSRGRRGSRQAEAAIARRSAGGAGADLPF